LTQGLLILLTETQQVEMGEDMEKLLKTKEYQPQESIAAQIAKHKEISSKKSIRF
jgi:hypothetical protein